MGMAYLFKQNIAHLTLTLTQVLLGLSLGHGKCLIHCKGLLGLCSVSIRINEKSFLS